MPSPFSRWLDSVVPALFPNDAALARAIGAPQSTVMRWRRGAVPSTRYLLRLATATDTSPATLLKIAGHQEDS